MGSRASQRPRIAVDFREVPLACEDQQPLPCPQDCTFLSWPCILCGNDYTNFLHLNRHKEEQHEQKVLEATVA